MGGRGSCQAANLVFSAQVELRPPPWLGFSAQMELRPPRGLVFRLRWNFALPLGLGFSAQVELRPPLGLVFRLRWNFALPENRNRPLTRRRSQNRLRWNFALPERRPPQKIARLENRPSIVGMGGVRGYIKRRPVGRDSPTINAASSRSSGPPSVISRSRDGFAPACCIRSTTRRRCDSSISR